MARNSQPPKDIAFEREHMKMVFSYAEWQELIDIGKFDFNQHDLTAATLHPEGFLGYHHGYPCFVDIMKVWWGRRSCTIRLLPQLDSGRRDSA